MGTKKRGRVAWGEGMSGSNVGNLAKADRCSTCEHHVYVCLCACVYTCPYVYCHCMYVYLSLLYVRMVQPNATIKNTCYCRVSTSLDTQISCICVYPPVHTYVVSVHVQVTLPFNVPQPHWATPPSFIDCQLHFRGWPRWGCVCGMGCIVWLLCDLWCCWLWLVWSDTTTKFWASCNIQQLVWCKNINEARYTWL